MRLNSLAFRLFVTSAAWTLLVLPVAGFIIYSLYREDVQLTFDAQLKKLLTALAVDSMNTTGDVPIYPQNLYEPLFEVPYSGWYWQVKPIDAVEGARLSSPSLSQETLPSPYEKKFPTDDTGTRWSNVPGPSGETIRTLEVIDSPGHDPSRVKYSVIVAGPLEWLEATNVRFRNRLTIALALAGLGLVTVTIFQVRFGLLPLRRIGQALAAVRSGKAARLEGRLPAEIEPLQTELNALIQSNEDIIDRARTQVGNLAHALKTPLAVITNEAREDKSPFAAKVADQARFMRDQVTYYLDRARMAAGTATLGRATVVEDIVEPLSRALERINRDKGVVIHTSIATGAIFQGEKQDLEEMLGNLLDNACKWARLNVRLAVATVAASRTSAARLRITIEDDGPGLTAAERSRIGGRGVRLDESKPGSGLGLSIVHDLATSYRGSLRLDASAHGGLLAELDLPAA